jgi:hypothetical protein
MSKCSWTFRLGILNQSSLKLLKNIRLPNGHYRIPETEILKMLYGKMEKRVKTG